MARYTEHFLLETNNGATRLPINKGKQCEQAEYIGRGRGYKFLVIIPLPL